MAVHTLRVVERGHFGSDRRWRPVLPAVTGGHLIFTGIGVLKQGQAEVTVATVQLLSARRQSGNSAVRRIDDQRRPTARRFYRGEHRVVGAGDVLPGPDLCANVAAGVARALRILRSSLLVGKELPGGVLCGPFERSIELVEPNAFETGMTPGSLWNSRW